MTRTRSAIGWPTLAVLAAIGTAIAGCPEETIRPPYNVLLVVIDTLRWDHVGCYGAARPSTPNIDALAAEAIRFERAFATAPWTKPSVASIITGLYPSGHGATLTRRGLPDEVTTLAEVLREQGYATAGAVSAWYLKKRFNLHQGYDRYLESEARGSWHISAPGVTTQATDFLRQFASKQEPFFLFVHYYDPHSNYRPHPQYGFAPASAGRLTGDMDIERIRSMTDDLTVAEIEFLKAIYDEEIRFTDAGIGQLLDTLRELDLFENTLIVLTADHGEEFLTHGWLGHTRTLYNELLRVPLIIRLPGKGPAAQVVTARVTLAAIMPTVLDLLDVQSTTYEFHASSLAGLFSGDDVAPASLFAEVDYVPLDPGNGGGAVHKKAIIVQHLKIIRDDSTQEVELYDLAADPFELVNLASDRPEIVERLLPLLDRSIVFARQRAMPAEETSLSTEEIELLRGLGYVGGG